MTIESMLTTVDNPHDPFDSFDAWYAFDEGKGYHSSAFLARISMSSDSLSDFQQNQENEAAIDEIVRENTLGLYRKRSRTVTDG
jgi:hypothetical protein